MKKFHVDENLNQNEEAKLILALTNNGNELLKCIDQLKELDKTKNSFFQRLHQLQTERDSIKQKITQLTNEYEKA